jgi:hypothetical protein
MSKLWSGCCFPGTPARDWLCHGYFRCSKQLLADLAVKMAGRTVPGKKRISPEVKNCIACEEHVGCRVPKSPPRAIELKKGS